MDTGRNPVLGGTTYVGQVEKTKVGRGSHFVVFEAFTLVGVELPSSNHHAPVDGKCTKGAL